MLFLIADSKYIRSFPMFFSKLKFLIFYKFETNRKFSTVQLKT